MGEVPEGLQAGVLVGPLSRLLASPRFLPALVVATAAALWLPPLTSCLWRDETYTWWVVKDGLPLALERSVRFQPWSPLYLFVEWAVVAVLGGGEAALRLPSLAAMAGAAAMLFATAKRLFDDETAWLAALAFVASSEASFYAVEARPYALALFFMLAALAALVRWLQGGDRRFSAAFVLCAAAMVYCHIVFAAAAVVFIAFTALHGGASRRQLAACAAGLAALLVPMGLRAAATWSGRGSLLWVAAPPWTALGQVLFPAPYAAAAAALLGAVLLKSGLRAPLPRRDVGLFVLAWAVAAPVALFAASRVGPWRFFIARYILWFVPGRALLAGALLGAAGTRSARALAALVLAAASVWSYAGPHHSFEDLRGAAAATRDAVASPGTPVLVPSSFLPSEEPGWLADPETLASLFAPQAYYPLAGRLVPLPKLPVPWAAQYTEALAARVLTPSGRFLLVVPRTGSKHPYQAWVEARLGPEGYALTRRGQLAGVEILIFERPTGRRP
ncbi:hypothetical protein EPO15_11415 [bacterium]|nr:MAG: hypothetical protein EPO15_11415 [bacterium]